MGIKRPFDQKEISDPTIIGTAVGGGNLNILNSQLQARLMLGYRIAAAVLLDRAIARAVCIHRTKIADS